MSYLGHGMIFISPTKAFYILIYTTSFDVDTRALGKLIRLIDSGDTSQHGRNK